MGHVYHRNARPPAVNGTVRRRPDPRKPGPVLPDAPAPGLGFVIGSSAWLRRQGVHGQVRVRLSADGLLLEGQRGSTVLEPEQVQRLRSASTGDRYRVTFVTRIWTSGDAEPLILRVRGMQFPAYYWALSGFATLVVAAGGMSRLECGMTVPRALLPLAFMILVLAGAVFISVFFLVDASGIQRYMPVLVGMAMIWVGAEWMKEWWPRPARTIEEFLKVLARKNNEAG